MNSLPGALKKYVLRSLLMATFHHASYFRRLCKNIFLTKTTSVLEMAATIQINELQLAPARLHLLAFKT